MNLSPVTTTLAITLLPVSTILVNRRTIYHGVADAGDKLFISVVDTGDKLFTGIVDTGDKLFIGVVDTCNK